jgi:hypothetical protein
MFLSPLSISSWRYIIQEIFSENLSKSDEANAAVTDLAAMRRPG